MAAVTLVDPRAGSVQSFNALQVTAPITIQEANGYNSVTFVYGPREVTLTPPVGVYEEVARPNKAPLLVRSGTSLKKISMELFLGSTNIEASVENDIAKLQQLAASLSPLTISYGTASNMFSDKWRITSLSVVSTERSKKEHAVTRANIEIELTQATAAQNTGNQTDPGKSSKKSYTIKKGDTIQKIINTFYKDASKKEKKQIKRLIIKWNEKVMPNPRKPPTGKTIKIPNPKKY